MFALLHNVMLLQSLRYYNIYIIRALKRSDVTGNRFEWEHGETKLYKTPLAYFIVSASSLTTFEVKAIEFHRIAVHCHYVSLSVLQT